MVKFSRPFSAPYLNRMLSRSLVVGAIATASWLSGLAPDLSGHSRVLDFNSAAYAQQVSEPEVTNYARAVLGIEPVRQEAYDEIKKILGSDNVPSINCYESLDALPNNARKIADNYCKRSKAIVERNGLSRDRFNEITTNLQNDPNLKTRVQDALIRIQNTP
ncbi:DUF4168 domain-containing protein [Chroococcidiopsis sp. CCMEE 29]|uniref:DUF4168 domain-containing protein n=1 Tax=Chroococcidiopsis sp. CCMEE 29 TaxID=155894 RepID=UPI00201FDE2C|nr:DUF4168 domain-containing protein [Chroococcidiopsis sp. CCMEE 29]